MRWTNILRAAKRYAESLALGGAVPIPGPQGPPGTVGAPGAKGDPGEGVPAGGLDGQVLVKNSNADFDIKWGDTAADGGYVPTDGWARNQLEQSVQNSLSLADSALQPVDVEALQNQMTTLQNQVATLSGAIQDGGLFATIEELEELPPEPLTMYFVGTTPNLIKYMFVGGELVSFGTADIDFSEYVRKDMFVQTSPARWDIQLNGGASNA